MANHLKGWVLAPPAKGACPTCAHGHEPALPHNQESLYYQYAFFDQHGRWPTWEDAMAHCVPEVREAWTAELVKRGYDPKFQN